MVTRGSRHRTAPLTETVGVRSYCLQWREHSWPAGLINVDSVYIRFSPRVVLDWLIQLVVLSTTITQRTMDEYISVTERICFAFLLQGSLGDLLRMRFVGHCVRNLLSLSGNRSRPLYLEHWRVD